MSMTGLTLLKDLQQVILTCHPLEYERVISENELLRQLTKDTQLDPHTVFVEPEPNVFWQYLVGEESWLLELTPMNAEPREIDARTLLRECPDDRIPYFRSGIIPESYRWLIPFFVWTYYAPGYANLTINFLQEQIIRIATSQPSQAMSLTQVRKKAQSGKRPELLSQYLKEIGETPLLSRDEEYKLAKRVQAGDQRATERMIKANTRFVVSVARQYQNQGMLLEDLINEGNVGLIKAVKRFDPDRGFKFISYGVWWIRQAILQALAEQSRAVRLPLNRVGALHKIGKISTQLLQSLGRDPSPHEIAEALAMTEEEVSLTMGAGRDAMSLDKSFTDDGNENTLLDVLEDESQESPAAAQDRASLRVEIEKALDSLTPREAEVLTLYFGLNGERALTLEEIGARFSLTRERVRQIKEKAIRRMRHATRSRSLRAYMNYD